MAKVLVSADDPRGPAAIQIVLDDAWTRHLDAQGRQWFGIPSQSRPGRVYRATDNGCTCDDLKYRPEVVCKHMLAVRLQLELDKEVYAF